MSGKGQTVPEAIRRLFNINVASESPLLKNKANSLVRNGLIQTDKKPNVQRTSVSLKPGQDIVLHNALIINAFFNDTKDVKRIFDDTDYRIACSKTIRAILTDRTSMVGEALQAPAAAMLADFIGDPVNDLRAEKVPNPFRVLPQAALGENANLLHSLLAQAASLDAADSFLLAYLNGDWQTAQKLSTRLDSDSPEVALLKDEVDRRISDAHEFNDLLKIFGHK